MCTYLFQTRTIVTKNKSSVLYFGYFMFFFCVPNTGSWLHPWFSNKNLYGIWYYIQESWQRRLVFAILWHVTGHNRLSLIIVMMLFWTVFNSTNRCWSDIFQRLKTDSTNARAMCHWWFKKKWTSWWWEMFIAGVFHIWYKYEMAMN